MAVAAAALALYLALLCPVPAGNDGSELALVLATCGLAHPTGYPLYTLAGHAVVVFLHAVGVPWGAAANAFSAIGGAAAVGALHALGRRLLAPVAGARAGWLALLPVAALALNPVWTSQSTVAEVHSWHLAWVAGAALLAMTTGATLAARPGGRESSRRPALAWGAIVGLGLAHHATSVLASGPLSLALLFGAHGAGRSALRFAAWTTAGAALPLLSLAYVAWRSAQPAPVQWPALEPTAASVLDHLTGAAYRTYAGRFAPSAAQQRLLSAYVYPWLAGAVAGAAATLLRREARAEPARVGLAVVVLLQSASAFLYGVPDPSPYFLPPVALGLVLLAVECARTPAPARARRALAAVACAGIAVFAVHGVLVARDRTRTYERFDARLLDMWTHVPPGPAFVVWDDDMAHRLRAFQIFDGLRPELTVVQPRLLSYPAARRSFRARFGVDPLVEAGGLPPAALDGSPDERRVAALVDGINRGTTLPVILFLPQVPSLRLLRKPDAAAGPPGAPVAAP